MKRIAKWILLKIPIGLMFIISLIGISYSSEIPIKIIISGDELQNIENGLRFVVNIVNDSDKPITINISKNVTPFLVIVNDESGYDINPENHGLLVDSTKNTGNKPIEFAPNAKRKYPITFQKYKDARGNIINIKSGIYKIKCSLFYMNNPIKIPYETHNIESEQLIVTIK